MHAPGLGCDHGTGRESIAHHVKGVINLRSCRGANDPLKKGRNRAIYAQPYGAQVQLEHCSITDKPITLTFLDKCVQVWQLAQHAEVRNDAPIRHVLVELGLKIPQDVPTTGELPAEVRQSGRRGVNTSDSVKSMYVNARP